jgi:hypothetical protein
MKNLNADFVNTAEQVNIWMFLGCFLLAVGCMFPEVVIGPTEFNVWLSLFANLSLIVLCILWLTTQTLWLVIRKVLESRNGLVKA